MKWLPLLVLLLLPGAVAATDTLVGAGDIAECTPASENTARLVEQVIADYPRAAVFTAGDNAYDHGSAADFAACYEPTWGRFRERTHPSPGNHEYRESGGSAYFDYFGAAAGDSDRGYYAWDLGAWRIYSLNSEGAINTVSIEQVEWLRSDLAANPRQCVLAYWHHPRWSSGGHGNYSTMDPLWDTLYDAGVELVISGHDHDYERFGRLDADGQRDTQHGMRQLVVGTGGGGTKPFAAVQPHSRVRITDSEGVLQLDLSASGYVGHFITPNGQLDSFDASCHAPPPQEPPTPQRAVILLGVFAAVLALLSLLTPGRVDSGGTLRSSPEE